MRIRGAREHNLDGIDLDLPRDALVVVTGVSGSGKSSLAFDTVYRESQRRFFASMSSKARLYMDSLARPEVEAIEGLRPALAIDQKSTLRSPRSTVGTLSGAHDHLRLLFARLGTAYCRECAAPIHNQTPASLAELLRARYGSQALELFALVVEDHRGTRAVELEALARAGVQRVWIDGHEHDLARLPTLAAEQRHRIEAHVGSTRGNAPEFEPLLQRAVQLGTGSVVLATASGRISYGTAQACGSCGAAAPRLGPRLFSFNTPHGACPDCQGLGVQDQVDPTLLVADPGKSLRDGALVPTTKNNYIVYSQVTMEVLDQVCRAHGFDVDTPWRELSPAQQEVIWFGSDRLEVPFGKHTLESRMKWSGITARPRETGFYKGLVPVITETLKRNRNANILRFVRSLPCHECAGSRLRAEARSVKVHGHSLAELCDLDLLSLHDTLKGWEWTASETPVATPIQCGLERLLDQMRRLGLGHLSLGRGSASLSGGEAQRIRLATQGNNGLQGLLYVLDEPSIGLHWRDQERMLAALFALRDAGNDVLVVEHDPAIMTAADWLVDIGPRAGSHGGQLLYSGPAGEIATAPVDSATRRELCAPAPSLPAKRTPQQGRLELRDICRHNLDGVCLHFLTAALNVISGVSGAGKSTLALEVLAPRQHARFAGFESIDTCIAIDASPIGRNPRSNPATYTGVFEAIRALFAAQPRAQELGLGRGDFSTNVRGGRCETCQGAGSELIGMHGLAPVTVPCEACEGRRFGRSVLEVTYQGRDIAAVLDLSIEDAAGLFDSEPKIAPLLQCCIRLGLGYLRLGQPATTLSGGEAQRVKLATELAKGRKRRCLYILDEPTTGLHPADTRVLIQALEALVAEGHTVVAVEHDLAVLAAADHLVDLGPEAGPRGGQVVGIGSPTQVAALDTPTGHALSAYSTQARPAPRKSRVPARPSHIHLRGVQTHNLRCIDADIPHGQLTVITGLSGSGKSSLAFDTLFAEAQRRFAECLSPQTRRFLGRLGGAEFRSAEGLGPTLAIRQGRPRVDRRGTVGTRSGILEPLRLLFSRCGRTAGRTSPTSMRALSFFHQQGACPDCEGLGFHLRCAAELLVDAPQRPLLDGAMDGSKAGRFYGERDGQYLATLRQLGREEGIDYDQAYASLDERARQLAMHGTGDREIAVRWEYQRGKRSGAHEFQGQWPGFCGLVDLEYTRKRADQRGTALLPLLREEICQECSGTRLRKEARALQVAQLSLPNLCAMDLHAASEWLETLPTRLDTRDTAIAAAPQAAALAGLQPLIEAGLGYLNLARRSDSLSSGEFQRLRIAAALSTSLEGVTYVLDEPTAGLHPSDTAGLLRLLRRLTEQGNTVVVVEHDRAVIEAADHILELGPGAGAAGGELVAAGSPSELRSLASSRTGRALTLGPRASPLSLRPAKGQISILGAAHHGIEFPDLQIPAGLFCVVTGRSGAGKSTLVFDVLVASARAGRARHCREIHGLESWLVDWVDASPPGKAAGSTPATYTGVFDAIRKCYARTAEARARGLRAPRFSYLAKQSRCPTCAGLGHTTTSMDFLPDLRLPCESCGGRRYLPEVLEVRYRGLDLAEVLQLSVAAAAEHFTMEPQIHAALRTLDQLGLGYLPLGQASPTLSGGEAQRLKLARALLAPPAQQTLFVLDEPTIGLHFDDVDRLLDLCTALIEAGHGLVVVEHHPDVIAAADFELKL